MTEAENLHGPDSRFQAFQRFNEKELTEIELIQVAGFLSDEDKDIRNLAAEILLRYDYHFIPGKITPLISSGDISVRNFAGSLLLSMGDKSVQPLKDFLRSAEKDDEKKFAIDLLGLIGNPDCEDDLLCILDSSSNENVIVAAIEALGGVKSEKAIHQLISLYGNNNLFDIPVVEALGKIGSPQVLNFIYSNFHQTDDFIKFSFIESLGSIGDEETFFFLLSELNESRGLISRALLKSIYLLKIRYHYDIPFDERMRILILDTIKEADEEIKNISLLMLADFTDKESMLACLKNYGTYQDLDEKIKTSIVNSEYIVSCFTEILEQEPKNISHLLNLFKEIIEAKPVLISSLSNVNLRSLLTALSNLISHHDEEIRMISFELLFIIDKRTALLFADSFVDDGSLWNRLRLIEILSGYGSSAANKIIERFINDKENMVSERAYSYKNSLEQENSILNTELAK